MNRRNHKKQKEASMHARSTLNSTGSWLRMFCVYLRFALLQTREEQEWEHDIDALCEKRWINSLCVVASFFSSFFVSLEILLFSVCCFSLFLSFDCCCYWWWWWLAGWLKLFLLEILCVGRTSCLTLVCDRNGMPWYYFYACGIRLVL